MNGKNSIVHLVEFAIFKLSISLFLFLVQVTIIHFTLFKVFPGNILQYSDPNMLKIGANVYDSQRT